MVISYPGRDPFVHQLKRLFSRMRDLRVAAISTRKLIDQWVGWDGQKLNPREQQDASEFCQMLIDKIHILGPSQLRNLFQIKTRMIIEGLDEPWRTERDDSSWILLLDIANCPNLSTSLERFHAVNYFCGQNQCYADSLKRKINAKGVSWISSLPDHLLIGLKRFEYDFRSQSRRKINGVLDFPLELDLASHCIPNVDFETRYRLTGVIVHSGIAQCGHSISYVLRGDTWYECNDTKVRQITIDKLLQYGSGRQSPETSAFVLVYLRQSVVEIDDAPIDEALQAKIKQRRNAAVQSRIFCNPALVDFVSAFAAFDNRELKAFALKYVFTTLCHTSIDHRGGEILRKLTNFEDALSIILDLDLVPAMIKCPFYSFREAILEYICTFKPNYDLFEKLKPMIPTALKQISHAEPFLALLDFITSKLDDKTRMVEIVPELKVWLINTSIEMERLSSHAERNPLDDLLYDSSFDHIMAIRQVVYILDNFGAAWDGLIETNELVLKEVWKSQLAPSVSRKLCNCLQHSWLFMKMKQFHY
jgi:hypothetical protein